MTKFFILLSLFWTSTTFAANVQSHNLKNGFTCTQVYEQGDMSKSVLEFVNKGGRYFVKETRYYPDYLPEHQVQTDGDYHPNTAYECKFFAHSASCRGEDRNGRLSKFNIDSIVTYSISEVTGKEVREDYVRFGDFRAMLFSKCEGH